MQKDLKEKAVDIKGKKYVLVSDRILYLSENLEGKYSIQTEANFYPEQVMWVVKATLSIDNQVFVGHAQEIIGDGYINKTSALENCETSAVGRACAMAGIGVIDSIASVDEINKAGARENYNQKKETKGAVNFWFSEKNKIHISGIRAKRKEGMTGKEIVADLRDKNIGVSKANAEDIISGKIGADDSHKKEELPY